MRTRPFVILILACFALLFALRFIHLTADPPYNLSPSGGPWGDPGGYSFNARNKILFDTWEVDDYNMMYTSFPPHVVTYVFFRVFGIGFAQQNAVPALFSCLSLIFFFLILRRRFDDRIALVGSLLLGLNYTFLMFSRIANREMPTIFFLVLGVYLLERSEKKPVWNIAAGLFLALGLISKSFIFFALGGILLGYFLYILFHHKVRGIIFRLSFLLTGALTILIPWLMFLYLPHRESITAFNNLNLKYLLPPLKLTKILEYFWKRPPMLLDSMPILAVLAGIISLILLHHIFVRTKKVHLTDWIFLNWFFAGSIYLSIIYQRVPRRFIVQIVPLVFLAVSFLPRLFSKKQTSSPSKPPLVFAAAVFVWALFPVSLFLKWIHRTRPKFFEGQISLSLALLILSLGLAVLVCSFSRVFAKKPLSIPRPASAALAGVLALLFLISHGSRYLKWAIHPPHQLQNISQDYGRAFDHAVFVGLWAPIISMENNHRAYEFFPGFINDDKNLFEKQEITHIFTTTAFSENQTYWRHFPHIRKKARLLARYHIWNVDALLYDVQGFPLPEGQTALEAERHTLEGAMPRFDENASGRFAVRPLFRRPGYVADIPVPQPYEKGIHSITAVLKRDKKRSKEESRIGRLEVLTEDGSDILGYRDIFPIDLNHVEYREIPISFHVRRPGAVRVRLYTQGNVVIWFDRLQNTEQHP